MVSVVDCRAGALGSNLGRPKDFPLELLNILEPYTAMFPMVCAQVAFFNRYSTVMNLMRENQREPTA